jgi:hypothetical protein
MRLARIDKALEDCDRHMALTRSSDPSKSFDPAIESLLTQALLVISYAEFEQRILATIEEKRISAWDGPAAEIRYRSVGYDDLAGILEQFSSAYVGAFKELCLASLANQRAVTFYNNIVTNRHRVAHSSGANTTFPEFKRFYEEGHVILDFFRETLLNIAPAQSQ